MINKIKEYLNQDIDSLMLTIEKPYLENYWYIIIPKEGLAELCDLLKECGELALGGKVIDITEFIR